MLLAVLLWSATSALAYHPDGKNNFIMSGDFLREIADRLTKDNPDLDYVLNYQDARPGARSLDRNLEEEQFFPLDYDSLDSNLRASIRDREFLEHSSLLGNQFMAGEGKQHLKPEGSTSSLHKNGHEGHSESTLPAYCNPPNPCPVGYTSEQGCLEEFENTASFSRRYQGSQDCMCDTEHMFECASPSDNLVDDAMDNFNDLDFKRFLQEMASTGTFQHKNLVAKKFHPTMQQTNPFLSGERLPVAAKKGTNVAA